MAFGRALFGLEWSLELDRWCEQRVRATGCWRLWQGLQSVGPNEPGTF